MTAAHDTLKKRSGTRNSVRGLSYNPTILRADVAASVASVRDVRVKKLAKGIASSSHFSTAAAYEDFVASKRK